MCNTVRILALAASIALAACGGPRETRVEGGPKAIFDISAVILGSRPDTTVVLGRVNEGEIVRYDAWLRNSDVKPMVITGVESSCGCTSVEYERKPIAPGERGRISFKFDSRGMWGVQLKLLEIRTSLSPARYGIFIESEVVDPRRGDR